MDNRGIGWMGYLAIALMLIFMATLPFLINPLLSNQPAIPPNFDALGAKSYEMDYSDAPRTAYTADGQRAGFKDYAILHDSFPWETTIHDVSFRIVDASQRGEFYYLVLEFSKSYPKIDKGEQVEIGVYRDTFRTVPLSLSDDLRMYITNMTFPSKDGYYETNTGQSFYSFKQVTIELVERG